MYGTIIIRLNKCYYYVEISMTLYIAIDNAIIIDYPTSNPLTPAYMLIAFD